MNNEQVQQLIQNLGLMCELWMITYNGFLLRGLNHEKALMHTKAFMSSMMETFVTSNGDGNEKEAK